jgi:hypothetical protein
MYHAAFHTFLQAVSTRILPFILFTEGNDNLKHGEMKMVCDRTHVALSLTLLASQYEISNTYVTN